MSRELQMEHGTNVVVVSIQSNDNKKILLFADWLFTTTFVRCSILQSLVIGQERKEPFTNDISREGEGGGLPKY